MNTTYEKDHCSNVWRSKNKEIMTLILCSNDLSLITCSINLHKLKNVRIDFNFNCFLQLENLDRVIQSNPFFKSPNISDRLKLFG